MTSVAPDTVAVCLDVVHSGSMPGGGSADAAAGQIQADALRAGTGAVSFLDRGDWWRLAVALVPLAALVILGFFLL